MKTVVCPSMKNGPINCGVLVLVLWRRKWQPTPVVLPGKSHGWRSVVGYSPWGCKESDMTEPLHIQSFLWVRHYPEVLYIDNLI